MQELNREADERMEERETKRLMVEAEIENEKRAEDEYAENVDEFYTDTVSSITTYPLPAISTLSSPFQ